MTSKKNELTRLTADGERSLERLSSVLKRLKERLAVPDGDESEPDPESPKPKSNGHAPK